MTSDKHSLQSSLREEYLEYGFLFEVCRIGWRKERFVEVARAATDDFGYDVVLECGGVTRHVQLKATTLGGRTSSQNIRLALREKPSGCVVWMWIEPETLEIDHFLWFGNKPGQRLSDLGDTIAKHPKATSEGVKNERPSLRKVSKGRFDRIRTSEEIFERLFGAQDA